MDQANDGVRICEGTEELSQDSGYPSFLKLKWPGTLEHRISRVTTAVNSLNKLRQSPSEDGFHEHLQYILVLEELKNANDVRMVQRTQHLYLISKCLWGHTLQLLSDAFAHSLLTGCLLCDKANFAKRPSPQSRPRLVSIQECASCSLHEERAVHTSTYRNVAVANCSQHGWVGSYEVLPRHWPEWQAAGASSSICTESPPAQLTAHQHCIHLRQSPRASQVCCQSNKARLLKRGSIALVV
mmetsp:Transcript_69945/g.130745  ORF Transcript_69945/g.130745 Transcript_69945/m.130745 type:complete len:241 (-) Transcript_69945:647-1369(-)